MITQCKFSDSVRFFEQKFLERWGLTRYKNNNDPCVFFGVYSTADVELIKSHTGYKVVIFVGADVPNIQRIKGINNVLYASDKVNILEIYKANKLPYFDKIIPVKDYSEFTPCEKGDKIYVYINNNQEGNKVKHMVGLLEPAINYFGKDKFLFGVHGHTMEEMIEEYYKKSFLNIQLNPYAGFASALEMAYMGRKSVSNNPAPFCINYKTPNSIIEIIKNEMNNKTLDYSVKNYLYEKNDWLNEVNENR